MKFTDRINFATSNQGKLREVSALYPNINTLKIDLPEIQTLDPKLLIEEKLKAANKLGYDSVMVEDTSLNFNCLSGLPGTFIKFFLENLKAAGLANLVLKYQDHTATAITSFGYAKQGKYYYSVSKLHGSIVNPRGNFGFGWDCIFMPEGQSQTLAEMKLEEKSIISPRAKAFKDLLQLLDF